MTTQENREPDKLHKRLEVEGLIFEVEVYRKDMKSGPVWIATCKSMGIAYGHPDISVALKRTKKLIGARLKLGRKPDET